MDQLNKSLSFLKIMQRALWMKDSIVVSMVSGIIGTLVMDVSNLIFWRKKKTEALYGHISGSVYMRPFRTHQRKNFWLGQITHLISGATLAYPLNIILKKTGKDYALLKGAFFGAVTWEFIYGFGRRFKIFSAKPHLTKTHYVELFNNMLYGITAARVLVFFSDQPENQDTQQPPVEKRSSRNIVQPIYADSTCDVENTSLMQ